MKEANYIELFPFNQNLRLNQYLCSVFFFPRILIISKPNQFNPHYGFTHLFSAFI